MVIINFFLAACKGDSLLYHCNCKGHDLLGTTIAKVIINYTLGLASSHYNSGPGQKLARGCWLTDRVFSRGGKPSSFRKSDRVFFYFLFDLADLAGSVACLLPPDQWSGFLCAWSELVAVWWQCGLFQQGIGAAIGYHRASLLLTYYIGYVGHVPGGEHEFLDAFLRPASYCK